jgi:hypothetical protein
MGLNDGVWMNDTMAISTTMPYHIIITLDVVRFFEVKHPQTPPGGSQGLRLDLRRQILKVRRPNLSYLLAHLPSILRQSDPRQDQTAPCHPSSHPVDEEPEDA